VIAVVAGEPFRGYIDPTAVRNPVPPTAMAAYPDRYRFMVAFDLPGCPGGNRARR
jgi:hypothetical protein